MYNFWEHLSYDPATGQIKWMVCEIQNQVNVGDVAGHTDEKGYRRIHFKGTLYRAHRLIWEKYNGPIPQDMQIDHINGNRDDNRIENLRLATTNQNQWNRKLNANSTSGMKGIRFMPNRVKPWQARVAKNNFRHCKYFECEQSAIDWLVEMRNKLHGNYQNQGEQVV